MKKIRTVVAGLGRIGWVYHLPQLKNHPGFELIAVADPMQERLEEAREFFPDTRIYTDVREMLETEHPDLAVIASPTIFHKEQILAAFECGADVFAEKPLSCDIDETAEIIAAMETSRHKLMVYQPRRLDKECQQAKELLASGILGKVHLIRRRIANFARRNDWQALKQYAGGMLNNYGVHFLDQLCYTAGFDFECEYCELRKVNAVGDAEDCFHIILRNKSGMTGEVEVSQSCAFPDNTWLIEGNMGTARYSSQTKMWEIRYIIPGQLKEAVMQTELAADGRLYPHDRVVWNEGYDFTAEMPPEYYDNLYAYLTGSGEPLVKIAETRRVMELLADARKLDEMRYGR